MSRKKPKIAHWNYRVRCVDHDGEPDFSIIEVYYDADDNIVAWSDATFGGDTPADLADSLRLATSAADLAMLRSAKRRPLTSADLPGDGA